MREGFRWLDIEHQRERNQFIMRLKDEQGLTYNEIAPLVGLSPRGVKWVVLRTRNGLSTCREG